jgi:SAM-dependent methyltransferase
MIRLLEQVLEHPTIYRRWQAPFVAQKFAPVQRHIEHAAIRRVLDVGCGPGTNAARFGSASYVGVDINDRYLAVARSKYPGQFIQADLATADLSTFGTFDVILVNSFLHHLPDGSVDRLLAQLATLMEPGGRVHILELVRPERFALPSIMARLDRGRYARSAQAWTEHFERHFHPVVLQPYTFGLGLWAMVYFQGMAKHAPLYRHSSL